MDEIKKRVGAGKESAPLTTRLVFSYDQNGIKLVDKRTLKMIAPPSDQLEVKGQQNGFWYEVKDAKQTTLYRRVIPNPIQQFVEVRSDNPDQPFTWAKVDKPAGMFVLFIPEIKTAQEVLLFSSPIEAEKRAPAAILTRVSLKTDQKRKEG
ncbi:MAG TPA: hypothetical protein VN376_07305 [Longilinea sp.]|nr:hypothetical protein [Longilinea sp.]